MLAGHPPYAATTPVALAEAQDAGAEPLLNVAPALDNAIRRALSPDPADRPSDVAAFAQELQAGLANEPTEVIAGIPVLEPNTLPNAFAPGPMWPVSASDASDASIAPASPSAPHARARSLPVPLAAAVALVFAAIVLAAIGPTDENSPAAVKAPSSVAPSTSPTATPPPAPEAPKQDKGKGNGKGSGKGNGKGGH